MLQGHIHILLYIIHILFFDSTFAATGNEVFVVSSKAGVDCVEALGHTLVLPHQHPVLKVPQVHSLQKRVEDKPITTETCCTVFLKVAQCLRSKYADIGKGGTGQKAYLSCYI